VLMTLRRSDICSSFYRNPDGSIDELILVGHNDDGEANSWRHEEPCARGTRSCCLEGPPLQGLSKEQSFKSSQRPCSVGPADHGHV
jgi:hypothetical protein